jgi:hypothetical protein
VAGTSCKNGVSQWLAGSVYPDTIAYRQHDAGNEVWKAYIWKRMAGLECQELLHFHRSPVIGE